MVGNADSVPAKVSLALMGLRCGPTRLAQIHICSFPYTVIFWRYAIIGPPDSWRLNHDFTGQ